MEKGAPANEEIDRLSEFAVDVFEVRQGGGRRWEGCRRHVQDSTEEAAGS
jgi:hypothetical protein